jgi:hypothetical protein
MTKMKRERRTAIKRKLFRHTASSTQSHRCGGGKMSRRG